MDGDTQQSARSAEEHAESSQSSHAPSHILPTQMLHKSPNYSLQLMIVEAVFLVTTVNRNQCSRPVYVSPTAVATRLAPMGYEVDTLHFFTGTESFFRIVVRFIGVYRDARMVCHEAFISDGKLTDLLVMNCEIARTEQRQREDEGSYAYCINLPALSPQALIAESSRLRIQVFDQERRLLFTKDWLVELGVMNDDALSWLREAHYDILTASKHSNQQDELEEEALKYSVFEDIETRSRAESISMSFVNVDDEFRSRSSSRSDSVITLKSPETTSRRPSTVDFIQQMGFWLYGSRVGQLMANIHDPRDNYKKLYSTSPLFLMGKKFVSAHNYPRVISLGPVKEVIEIASPVSCLQAVLNAKKDGYNIKECLRVKPIDQELVFVQLVSWLESLALRVETSFASGISVVAVGANVEIQLDSCHNNLIVCSLHALDGGYLRGRTIFVDLLSRLLTMVAEEVPSGASIELLYLYTSGSQISIGPDPNSLFEIHPSNSDLLECRIPVLLWSDHIHDWVERELVLAKGSIYVELRSPLPHVEPLNIDLTRSRCFYFADSTRRFSFSHPSFTWLCLMALSDDDLSVIIASISSWLNHSKFLRKTTPLPVHSRSQSLERRDSKVTAPAHSRSPSKEVQQSDVEGDIEAFLDAFETCFWFTYRKDFPRLSPSILSSDAGFGCMMRCGQSLMAEAIVRTRLKRQVNVGSMLEHRRIYKEVLKSLCYANGLDCFIISRCSRARGCLFYFKFDTDRSGNGSPNWRTIQSFSIIPGFKGTNQVMERQSL